jgi:hypothetical protein
VAETFEYTVEYVAGKAEMKAHCEEMGKQGWRLVSVMSLGSRVDKPDAMFFWEKEA